MKRSISILAFTIAAASLAACGGGAGGAIPSVATRTSAQPTAQPTAQAQAATIIGTVAQLAGPLSSATWSLAAPSGCPSANQPTASCASYPTPPTNLPSATATPQVGAGVGGVTVYAVAQSAVYAGGVPVSPIATATSSPSGGFTITLPASAVQGESEVGLVAVDGSSVTASGATNLGYTVAHAIVSLGSSSSTLLIDKLSQDEQVGFAAVNANRVAAGLTPITSDTTAQAVARLAVAQRVGAATCADQVSDSTVYAQFNGVGTTIAWGDTAGPQWAVIANYESPWNGPATLGGFAALYDAAQCGTGYIAPINYFAGEYIEQ